MKTTVLYLTIISGVCAAEVPTYNKDVAPILYQKCMSCHRAGEVGPFPLASFKDAVKHARQIVDVTDDRIMPPWKPVAGHGEFKGARKLEDSQIATLKAWVDGGKIEGAAADYQAPPEFPTGWHCGEPDLILKVAKPFEIPAEGPDIYVHFVLPLAFSEDKYVRGVQIRPSDRRVAHHGVILLDGSGKAREMAARHDGDHYPNFGGPGFIPRGFLPGYAPGMTTRIPAAGAENEVSLTLGKGLDVVLQMHYHPTGRATTDQPQIGLYFTTTPPKRGPAVVLMANNDVDIAPGEARHANVDEFKLPVDFEVRDIWGHMHMIGKTLKVVAKLPQGGTRDLLEIDDWDFNWQDTYIYQNPFVLPKDTVIHAEWTWDNSAANPRNPNNPPTRIVLGEGSTDEMSGLIIGGITVNQGLDEGIMWLNVLGHYMDAEGKSKAASERRKAADMR
ncbi:MAG: ascorbate-dependent monooxygenase [Luteolibacter sp.]|uniref:ascorbate-dependent monooxygenase n=1 Tax=Luteolibacter sp. TaxID=1962973 RepID=UPI003266FC7B